MNKFIFLMSILSCLSGICCPQTEWNGDGRHLVTCFDSKLGATISASCVGHNCWAKKTALATRGLSKKNLSAYEETQNLGSRICRIYKGTILIVKQESGDEAAFCEGPDQSVIDLNSLRKFLRF